MGLSFQRTAERSVGQALLSARLGPTTARVKGGAKDTSQVHAACSRCGSRQGLDEVYLVRRSATDVEASNAGCFVNGAGHGAASVGASSPILRERGVMIDIEHTFDI